MGIRRVAAKVDTGAYSNAIHVSYARLETAASGEEVLCFLPLSEAFKAFTGQEIRTKNFTKKKVRSSTGVASLRFKVSCEMLLGGEKIPVDFTLTDRSEMRFPVLIGRKALHKRFLVDVAATYLLSTKHKP
ncbi:hypothetical protein A3SI_01211 [Nitritalea halalkaliphila LW7]|uniref:Retropepsin-like aspartic endopeptidase domain-containing protein n=1 Tax=Nitritalea halalkaliphila LW7 TaxID=1189621 RepID=I5CA21_9BACT|nr:RimK/LysX family protein [Nitritalea halalkaliphila]EIM78673.1 hypothetical protein A3SI_01211 [Nitritalea halalkaliphila LW7]